ncbi:TPR repeat-containing protein [Calothrix parasitica NIES-267]|uniref:TPR repeat-containing protein n=1 Tax=Calothrix parasitica NIES-267 TaxID=1973488 RepID=A0A1Z4LMP9_9CYAN|nr:TPR repeat-containing protein [Calothrix parasitica NIES-267]
MQTLNFVTPQNSLQQLAEKYFHDGDYIQAVKLYEEIIKNETEIKLYYWHLGLCLLLQGEQEQAQLTWFMGMQEGEPEEIEQWTQELSSVINTEADRRESLEEYQSAWIIRQHLREINPHDINNLLYIVNLSIILGEFTKDLIESLSLIELINNKTNEIDISLLLSTVKNVLGLPKIDASLFDFIKACIHYSENIEDFIDAIILSAIDIAYYRKQPLLASRLAEICISLEPDNHELLLHLSFFYQDSNQLDKSIINAQRSCGLAQTLPEKAFANHLLIRALKKECGDWETSYSQLQHQKLILSNLITDNPTDIEETVNSRLYSSAFFLPYFEDNARKNRHFQSRIAQIVQQNYSYLQTNITTKTTNIRNKVLKIGYLSHCLKKHSVGWLSRWIYKHHNPDKFQIYTYFINNSHNISDFTKINFFEPSYKAYKFTHSDNKIWEQIQVDDIDILIDLDSITLDIQGKIMAAKAAPIQVTWLGWDASGLPSIDYFIADPYVLPSDAQDYYSEKIWRLPQTYIAVDGFEVDVPTLRREDLGISSDAIVYFMVQSSYKINLPNLRLQMKILKETPNSYLLIKGLANKDSSQEFFEAVAEEEGVSPSQLRFLPFSPTEATHRANLAIADVVLDTYPYNGATTTLETLWMCVPLVTRVGEQFAARNSYTMMMNAGITEGIAWTDEEYIEWGIRLGKDAKLRQEISWKLRQSRQTAPLWNGKQFTREMEKAYEQMWANYISAK